MPITAQLVLTVCNGRPGSRICFLVVKVSVVFWLNAVEFERVQPAIVPLPVQLTRAAKSPKKFWNVLRKPGLTLGKAGKPAIPQKQWRST